MKFRRFSSKEKGWHPLAPSQEMPEEEEVTGSSAGLTSTEENIIDIEFNEASSRTENTLVNGEKSISTKKEDSTNKEDNKMKEIQVQDSAEMFKMQAIKKDVIKSAARCSSQTPLRNKNAHQSKMNRIKLDMTRREHESVVDEHEIKVDRLQRNVRELTMENEDLRIENNKLRENVTTSYRLKNYYRRILTDYVAFCDSLEQSEHRLSCKKHPMRNVHQKQRKVNYDSSNIDFFSDNEGGRRRSTGQQQKDRRKQYVETTEDDELFVQSAKTTNRLEKPTHRSSLSETTRISTSERDDRRRSTLMDDGGRRHSTPTDNGNRRSNTLADKDDRRRSSFPAKKIVDRSNTLADTDDRRRSSLPVKKVVDRSNTLVDTDDRRRSSLPDKKVIDRSNTLVDNDDRRHSTFTDKEDSSRCITQTDPTSSAVVDKDSLEQSEIIDDRVVHAKSGERRKWSTDKSSNKILSPNSVSEFESVLKVSGDTIERTSDHCLAPSDYDEYTERNSSNNQPEHGSSKDNLASNRSSNVSIDFPSSDVDSRTEYGGRGIAKTGDEVESATRGSNTSYDAISLKRDPSISMADEEDYQEYDKSVYESSLGNEAAESNTGSHEQGCSEQNGTEKTDYEDNGEYSTRSGGASPTPNDYEWDPYVPAPRNGETYTDEYYIEDGASKPSNISMNSNSSSQTNTINREYEYQYDPEQEDATTLESNRSVEPSVSESLGLSESQRNVYEYESSRRESGPHQSVSQSDDVNDPTQHASHESRDRQGEEPGYEYDESYDEEDYDDYGYDYQPQLDLYTESLSRLREEGDKEK